MPGYQTGHELANKLDGEDGPDPGMGMPAAGAPNPLDDEPDYQRPLRERAMSTKWKVRLDAYKEIHELFKQHQDGPSQDGEASGPFDAYGSLLQGMVQDHHSVASYEGLQCMLLFVKKAIDIKDVSFASHNYLLEKVLTNKPNFRDVTSKIIVEMLQRDQGSYLYPEILNRIPVKGNNNTRVANFAMFALLEAFKVEAAIDEINIKTLFRSIQPNLSH